jgi:hypothetical protein
LADLQVARLPRARPDRPAHVARELVVRCGSRCGMRSNTAWYRSAMPEHCLETLVNHAKTPSDFVATTWSIVARDPFETANHNGYQLLRGLPRARVANCCAFTRTGNVSFPFCFANSPSAYRRPHMPKNLCRTSRQSYALSMVIKSALLLLPSRGCMVAWRSLRLIF